MTALLPLAVLLVVLAASAATRDALGVVAAAVALLAAAALLHALPWRGPGVGLAVAAAWVGVAVLFYRRIAARALDARD